MYVDLENLRSAASSVSTAVAPAGSITATKHRIPS